MRLVSYRVNIEAEARLGAVIGDFVVDLAQLGAARNVPLPAKMIEFIGLGPQAVTIADQLVKACGTAFPLGAALPLGDITLLAPIPRPRKNIFGIGLNYKPHVDESAKSLNTSPDLPKQPVIFSKPPTTVIASGDAIRHNAAITEQLDWEVELAVIIGATARAVSKADALKHVFGYSVINDISARDNRRAGQWIYSKGMDTFAPMGPAIVTADEIKDPQNLELWLKKNGEIKQKGNTKDMLFDIATLISDISQGITLEPGDIIASGTPEGVGAGRTPQEWLWPGDVVEACVEGIGVIRNPVVSAA